MNHPRTWLAALWRTGVIVVGSAIVVAVSYFIAVELHELAVRQLDAGQAHRARGDFLMALLCFDTALRLDRWLSEARLLRASATSEYISSTGKQPPGHSRDSALDDIDAYLIDHPNSGEAYYQRGAALTGLAKVEQARAALAQAIRLLDDPSKALVDRAALSFHVGQYVTAVEEISGAIERHPLVADYYESRALYRRFIPDERGARSDGAKADRLRAATKPDSVTLEDLKKLEELKDN
jgi:tetratricopeptide (TPR) repeat protein